MYSYYYSKILCCIQNPVLYFVHTCAKRQLLSSFLTSFPGLHLTPHFLQPRLSAIHTGFAFKQFSVLFLTSHFILFQLHMYFYNICSSTAFQLPPKSLSDPHPPPAPLSVTTTEFMLKTYFWDSNFLRPSKKCDFYASVLFLCDGRTRCSS